MQSITFAPNQVRNKNLIVINGDFPEDNIIYVKSPYTGKVLEFMFDPQLTEQKCMENEGWDGEERHKFYVLSEYTPGFDVTIDFWHSPYLNAGGF